MGGAGYRVVFGVAAAVVIGGEEPTYFVPHRGGCGGLHPRDSWCDRRSSGRQRRDAATRESRGGHAWEDRRVAGPLALVAGEVFQVHGDLPGEAELLFDGGV